MTDKSGIIAFLTVLPLVVRDILVAEQPSSEEWHIAIQSESCPGLKGDYYDHGILCTIEECVCSS
jgi:hypothetical protein